MPTPSAQVPSSVVIVGAGLAGAQTAAALRKHGFEGRVTVLGAEGLPPYDRPPLSKELLKRTEPVWLADDLGIDLTALADDLRLADPAVRLEVDRERVVVRTASGDDVDGRRRGARPRQRTRPAGGLGRRRHPAHRRGRGAAARRPGARGCGSSWWVPAGSGRRSPASPRAPVPASRSWRRARCRWSGSSAGGWAACSPPGTTPPGSPWSRASPSTRCCPGRTRARRAARA